MMVSSSTLRRRQPRVAMVSGMAASSEPSAYAVTICPASAALMPSPALICGNKPAGKVSVTMQINPVMARASRPATGRRSASAGLAPVVSVA